MTIPSGPWFLLLTLFVLIPEARAQERLLPFERGGRWGYVRAGGEIAIEAKFDSARSFENGKARVKRDGKWIWIDERGNAMMDNREEGSVGSARMEKDGTIVLQLRAESLDGMVGDALLRYPVSHPEYKNILRRIGGLEPGEEKPVPPWEEKERKGESHPFTTMLDAEWKEIQPRESLFSPNPQEVIWNYSVSPPFPAHWPPDGTSQHYYYVFGTGVSPRTLADGVYIAAPWGRVEVQGAGYPKFTRLTATLVEIGIQGVRPLTQEESSVYEMKETAEGCLRGLTLLPADTDRNVRSLREYYCSWLGHNGVAAAEIRKLHIRFFDWLGCR